MYIGYNIITIENIHPPSTKTVFVIVIVVMERKAHLRICDWICEICEKQIQSHVPYIMDLCALY